MKNGQSQEELATLAMRDQAWADLRDCKPVLEDLVKAVTPALQLASHSGCDTMKLIMDTEQTAIMLQALSVCIGDLVMREEGTVV